MYLEHGMHNVLLNTKRQNKQGLNLPLLPVLLLLPSP